MKGLTPLIAALLLLAKLVCASPSLRTLKTSVPMVTRKSRRVGRSSGSSDSAVNILDKPELQKFRLPLATYIKHLDKAAASSHGRFYLLRTNEWKSLARILGLGPKSYSALLLACKLVEVQKLNNGSHQINVRPGEWESFLSQYGLKEKFQSEAVSYTSDLQKGGINENAMIEEEIETDEQLPHMHMIRVGKIRPGLRPVPGTREINLRLAPPRMNLEMHRAKDDFFEATQNLLSVYTLDHEEDVDIVEDWVLMREKNSVPENELEPENARKSDADGEETPVPAPPATPSRSSNRAYVSPNDSKEAGDKRNPVRQQGESPRKKMARPAEQFGPSDSRPYPDKIYEKLPTLAQFNKTDDMMSMEPEQLEKLVAEIAHVCERVERPDICDDLKKQYPFLNNDASSRELTFARS